MQGQIPQLILLNFAFALEIFVVCCFSLVANVDDQRANKHAHVVARVVRNQREGPDRSKQTHFIQQ